MGNQNSFSRSDRVRKALMREVSDIIAREVKDPALQDQLISVTDVELSNDLRHARVFISILGNEEKQGEILAILKEAQPQIRSMVGQRIRLRYTPEIDIRHDQSLERGTRVTSLLNQIARGEID
ncbi:MAG: 30S ribosome-binding factor RbfA [Vampirovibrionales bacterium]|nr:30S ribosome-binding factor RbfA [Vampirovibrionales bacterium]